MITENLSTLKIHKLTQAQYERELEAGRIDENVLYLTPDEEADLSLYATQEYVNDALAEKQPIGDYALKSDISAAVNTALAQAKASGEFNGKDGYSPIRGTDYWTDADKAEIKTYVDEVILGGAW